MFLPKKMRNEMKMYKFMDHIIVFLFMTVVSLFIYGCVSSEYLRDPGVNGDCCKTDFYYDDDRNFKVSTGGIWNKKF